jgi:predicted transcriptional regulator
MASLTVRIGESAHRMLQELAEQTGTSMQAVLEKAVSEYQRKCFLEGLNADFATLRNNPKAWQEELEERALWDSTLADGLAEE